MTVEAPRRPRSRQPDPKYMTFVEHLQELRQRLTICVLVIAAGSIVGWFAAPHVIHILDAPLRHALHGHQSQLIVTDVYGGFTLQLKIAIMIGFSLALPVTVYELWAFIAPAFGPNANRWAPIWISSFLGLFAAGGAVGFYVIPLAVNFFTRFQGPDVQLLPFASNYVSFVALILVVFGISFELPLVLVSLTSIGVTSSRWLSSKRAYFFFGVFIFSTVITPGADLISPLILGGILYVLFEASVIISRLMGK